MGVFSCDSRLGKKISSGDQVAPEREGVSIFFGRSSIDSVKSLAVKRCNSIPKEFEEDANRAPVAGSVARKAAFFDHYIRTVSLEKKAVFNVVEEAVLPSGGEQEPDEENGMECLHPVEKTEDGHTEKEQCLSASELQSQEDVQCSIEPTDYLEQRKVLDEIEDEESSAATILVPSFKPLDLTVASEKITLEADEIERLSAAVPFMTATTTTTSQIKKSKSARVSASAPEQQIINKWKQGLIPGVRASHVTSKTTTDQSGTKKSFTSSRVARTKNESAVSTSKEKEKSTRLNGGIAANGFTFRSNERAEKRKEFNRRMEEKQNAKDAEKNKIQAKTQEEQQAEIKELRRGLNFKATPMPGFYQEQSSQRPEVKKVPSRIKPQAPSDHASKLKKTTGASSKNSSSAIAVSS